MRLGITGPRRRRVAAATLLLAVVAAAIAGLLRARVDTMPSTALPAGDPAVQALDSVASEFGGDAIVVLAESESARRLLAPDQLPVLLGMEGRLSSLPDVSAVYGPATTLNQIAGSGQNLLAGLSGNRDAERGRAEQSARARGDGDAAARRAGDEAVAVFDQRYLALLVRGMPAGLPTLRNPEFVNTVLFEQSGLPRAQWRFVLPSPNAVAVVIRPAAGLDQAAVDRLTDAVHGVVDDTVAPPPAPPPTPTAGKEPQRVVPLDASRVTVTGVPVVTAALADRVRSEGPLLGALAVLIIAGCYLTTSWTARRRDRILPIVATLLGTAATAGLFGLLGRPLSIGAVAFLPVLIGIGSDFPAYLVHGARRRQIVVAALAAAGGFAALAISPLPLVRDLGLALAVGVLLALAIAALLRTVLPRDGDSAAVAVEPVAVRPPGALRRRLAMGAAVTAIAAIGWTMLPRLDLAASPEDLAAGLPAVSDAAHAEEVMGSSGEIRVVLRGPDVLSPAALDWARSAEAAVVRAEGSSLRPIVTLPDVFRFLGNDPSPAQSAAASQLLPEYLTSAVVNSEHTAGVLSFGVRLQDLGDQKEVIDELRAVLPPTPQQFSVELSGLPVVAARGYELVAADRWLAAGAGIVVAGVVLLAGLRRRSDAVRAVAAAALATGWGLAAAAAAGLTLSPLTIALGSLTTATGCEFTVMLADARRRGRSARGLHRTVLIAALAAAGGYVCLTLSGLVVLREFGLLLAVAVLLSLAAVHVVLWLAPPRPDADLDLGAEPATGPDPGADPDPEAGPDPGADPDPEAGLDTDSRESAPGSPDQEKTVTTT